jgi:hypothetical protein
MWGDMSTLSLILTIMQVEEPIDAPVLTGAELDLAPRILKGKRYLVEGPTGGKNLADETLNLRN